MTSISGTNSDTGGPDAGRRSDYCVPRGLTPAGEEAFREAVKDYVARLTRQVNKSCAHRTDPLCTADAVAEARTVCERVRDGRVSGDRSDRATLAAILLTVATLGVSVMANFLHAPWQFGVFGFFVVLGVLGLILTWTSRKHRQAGSSDG